MRQPMKRDLAKASVSIGSNPTLEVCGGAEEIPTGYIGTSLGQCTVSTRKTHAQWFCGSQFVISNDRVAYAST